MPTLILIDLAALVAIIALLLPAAVRNLTNGDAVDRQLREQYVAILAAFASNFTHLDHAWELAEQVAGEMPDDLRAASREVVKRAGLDSYAG